MKLPRELNVVSTSRASMTSNKAISSNSSKKLRNPENSSIDTYTFGFPPLDYIIDALHIACIYFYFLLLHFPSSYHPYLNAYTPQLSIDNNLDLRSISVLLVKNNLFGTNCPSTASNTKCVSERDFSVSLF